MLRNEAWASRQVGPGPPVTGPHVVSPHPHCSSGTPDPHLWSLMPRPCEPCLSPAHSARSWLLLCGALRVVERQVWECPIGAPLSCRHTCGGPETRGILSDVDGESFAGEVALDRVGRTGISSRDQPGQRPRRCWVCFAAWCVGDGMEMRQEKLAGVRSRRPLSACLWSSASGTGEPKMAIEHPHDPGPRMENGS